MKKSAKIYIVVLVWLSAMVQFFVNEEVEAGQQIAEAFCRTDIMHYDSSLAVEGVYGTDFYSDEKVCNILGNIMKNVAPDEKTYIYKGTTDNIWYGVLEDNDLNIVISFVRGSEGENSILKTEVYIKSTESNLETGRQPVDIWTDELSDLYEKLGIQAKTDIVLSGSYDGRLNNADKAICRQRIEDGLENKDVEIAFYYHESQNVTDVEVRLDKWVRR